MPRAEEFRGAIVADLPRGRIETRDRRRLLAVPADWFGTLVEQSSSVLAPQLGASLGALLAPDVRARLSTGGEASADDVTEAVNAAVALRGLGTVTLERWGDALAFAWKDAPGTSEAWREVLASLLATLVNDVTGLASRGAPVPGGDGVLYVLLGSEAVCDHARSRVRSGESLPTIVARLSRPATTSGAGEG